MNQYEFDHNLAGTRWCAPYSHFPGANKVQDLTVPALEPPKRFLMEGSSVWVGTRTRYEFRNAGNPSMGHRDHVHVKVNKYHYNYPYVRLMSIFYYFMRDKNCMREQKGMFDSIVYNLETRLLYTVKGQGKFAENGKKIGHKKICRRVSVNRHGLPAGDIFSKRNKIQFLSTVMRKLKEDVPEVLDEGTNFKNRLIALNIQHRVGRPIPGLNDDFVNNMTELSKSTASEGIVRDQLPKDPRIEAGITGMTCDGKELARLTRNLQKRTTYQFMPTLKKTHSVKKALKAMLFKGCYISILPSLIHNVDLSQITHNTAKDLTEFLFNYNDNVPKALRHHIAGLCGSGNYAHVMELLGEIMHNTNYMNSQHHRRIHGHPRMQGEGLNKVRDAWIKTMIRLNRPIRWHLWKDLYDMAHRLEISRVRPGKFNTMEDIRTLHDTFSTIMRIRNPSKYVIDKSLMTFLEVDYPKGILEGVPGGPFEFIQILTPEDLKQESDAHGHCVHGYSDSCFEGKSIIFRLELQGVPLYTVEFKGTDMRFSQAEGSIGDDGRRNRATQEIIDSVIIPFQKKLIKAEGKLSLNYQTRAVLLADLAKIWTNIPKLEAHVETSEIIDQNLELINTQLEERLVINRMINDGVEDSEIIEKLSEIKTDLPDFAAPAVEPLAPRALPVPAVQAPPRAVPGAPMIPMAREAVEHDFAEFLF